MKKALALLVLTATLLCLPAAASVLETASFEGRTYKLLDVSSWTDAQAEAESLGGHLVTIDSDAENSWLASNWGSNLNLWIGFTDQDTEGTFMWISGSGVTFTHWNAGEPNDFGDEDFAYIIAGLTTWNDVPNTSGFNGVVELEDATVPEPSTGAMLALGVGGVVLLRRKYLA